MSWKREGDTVILRMDIDDWERLVFCLGVAAGQAEDLRTRENRIGLMNRLADECPNFIPYEVSNPADRETPPENLRNSAGWPQLRDAMEVQRAHDQLIAIVTGQIDTGELSSVRHKGLMTSALDVLCWALKHKHNTSFERNLETLSDAIREAGYEEQHAEAPFTLDELRRRPN